MTDDEKKRQDAEVLDLIYRAYALGELPPERPIVREDVERWEREEPALALFPKGTKF